MSCDGLYLPMDSEASGADDLVDVTNNGYNIPRFVDLNFPADPTIVPGQAGFGNARQFRGTAPENGNDVVKYEKAIVGTDPVTNGTDLSVSFWFFKTGGGGSEEGMVERKVVGPGSDDWTIKSVAAAGGPGGVHLQGIVGGINWPTGVIALDYLTWYNVVLTHTNGGGAEIYVNGTLMHTTAPTTRGLTSNRFIIGGGNFVGYLDDIRILPQILSPTEISDIYARSLIGQPYQDADECNQVRIPKGFNDGLNYGNTLGYN